MGFTVMPKKIPYVAAGTPVSATAFNRIIDEIRRLQNIQGGDDIKITHTPNGVIVARERRILVIDDKYRLHLDRVNESDEVKRSCDQKAGDLADIWRVRACVDEDPNENLAEGPEALKRLHWLINRSFGGGGAGGEGGYITDAARPGLDLTEFDPEWKVATPLSRTGQIGDIVILDEGDLIAATEDGDVFCYSNIRHDAHFFKSQAQDGSLYLTDTPPGNEPNGLPIKGELVGDPAIANTRGELLKESVEWRPQVKLPTYDIVQDIYQHPNAATYRFPRSTYVPDSNVQASVFGVIGRNEAWSAHYQIPYKIPNLGFGFLVKYSAANPTGTTQYAYMKNDWKVVDALGSMSTLVGVSAADFLLPVPAGSVETTLRHYFYIFVPPASLIDWSLIMTPTFARIAGDVNDTLTGRLLIVEVKPTLGIYTPPP